MGAPDLRSMTKEEKLRLLALLDEKVKRQEQEAARGDLLTFAQKVYPGYSVGAHHRHMARLFQEVAEGKKKRVIINIAPRHGKSELTSYLFPAWFLGQKPDAKIIMATHTSSLSEDFGRRVRNLVASGEYRDIFPNVELSADSKASGSWNTNQHGKYYAVGVGGALAGRGADLLVIDDPHSEQDVRTNSSTTFEGAWNWYQSGPRQRLMWGGAIIVVMTRWSLMDLTGKLLSYAAQNPDGDQWEVVEFPAILPSGKSLWPEKWPVEELLKTKATIDPRFWNAQYLQNPTADELAIIKRDYWRIWPGDDPPKCVYIMQSWDTAHETKTTSDYSACTTWGVFMRETEEGKEVANIILLDAYKDRMDFPTLKKFAFDYYREWKPDTLLVEKKAAGAPLIQELRAQGLPVQEFSPSRGNDKTVRMNAAAAVFESGLVWAPDTRWAKEVAEECAVFPVGEHDDFCDTVSQAILRFRAGGFLKLPTDEPEPKKFFRRRRAYY